MNLELMTGTEHLADGVVDVVTTPQTPNLVGTPVTTEVGYSRVELRTNMTMLATGSDFVRGGIVFGLADHAAMLALEEPGAVLEAADTRFLRPVGVDQLIVAEAHARMKIGKRRHAAVTICLGEEKIFEGDFTVCLTEAR